MHDPTDSKHQGQLCIEGDIAYWIVEPTGFYESQRINYCPYCGEDVRTKIIARCYHGMPKNCCDVCDDYHGDRSK